MTRRSAVGSGDREEALVDAVAALRRRERSVAELRSWLLGRAVAESDVEEVVAELTALGELDDERFALAFAADKRELAGWGPERIEAALLERGIEVELAERAGSESHAEQLDRAVGLLAKRGGGLALDGERSRALASLLRRGYDYEVAYEAVRRADRGDGAAAA